MPCDAENKYDLCKAALLVLLTLSVRPATSLPHLVVVVGDDFGSHDAGAYRGGRIPTPAVDALVEQGLLMDSFYVFQICSPTRSSRDATRSTFPKSWALIERW